MGKYAILCPDISRRAFALTRCVQVKIHYVHGHELCIFRRNDTVEGDFCCCKARCFCADVAGVEDVVAANGEANAAGIQFLRAIGDNNSEVGRFAAFRNVLELYKERVLVSALAGMPASRQPCANRAISSMQLRSLRWPLALLRSFWYSARSPVSEWIDAKACCGNCPMQWWQLWRRVAEPAVVGRRLYWVSC